LVTLPDSMLPDREAPPQPNPCVQPVSPASTISPPNPAFPPPPPAYCGQRRPLVFATGANVGLKLGFGAGTAPVPSSIKFGYNREEASVIPLQREQPAQGKPDQYAPVLAAMDLDLRTTAEAAGTNLGITQFFATGSAARNLAAYNPDIRHYFKAQAGAAVQQAALNDAVAVVARERQTAYDAIVAYFDKFQRIGFGIARDNLLQESRLTSGSAFARLKAAPTREDFLNYVQGESGLINRLAPAAVSLSVRQ
jgi:hypothetical protein